jgi:hypothetical protein
MNEEEKKAIEYSKNCLMKITLGIDCEFDVNILDTLLNIIKKLQKENEELKEIDEKRTWTVNNVIAEYIPDYELISLVNRYKDESFIPRVEVEKILNDKKNSLKGK